ncbi:MAG TPA: hypothetical protein VHO69_03395 [Phototrophicaceae bacterium]|nr:hypothetical protein [Phototrophicaceae bacterium]
MPRMNNTNIQLIERAEAAAQAAAPSDFRRTKGNCIPTSHLYRRPDVWPLVIWKNQSLAIRHDGRLFLTLTSAPFAIPVTTNHETLARVIAAFRANGPGVNQG